jgi:hypothetical protein
VPVLERLRVASGPVPAGVLSQRAFVAEPVAEPRREPRARAQVIAPTSADLFEWLFTGALAHPSGAIAGWRDRPTGRISDEYPEITGYFLSAAVYADATDSPVAARAADWLCERIENDASASRRVDGSAVYNFDQGIIAAGLIKYGVRAGSARAVSAGIRAASRLRDQVDELGHLPTLDPAAGPLRGRPATWSTVGRLHLAKTVQCLLLAAELGAAGMREAARAIVDDVSSAFSLTSDGLRDEAGRINLHATCYALEGLWIWHSAHPTTDIAEILRAAVLDVISHQRPSGGFPRLASTAQSAEQCDVHAQVIRLAALLGSGTSLAPSIARLRHVASPAGRGWAVPYQPTSGNLHDNAWATMFAAQALALVDGRPELEWWELI